MSNVFILIKLLWEIWIKFKLKCKFEKVDTWLQLDAQLDTIDYVTTVEN